MQGSAPLASRHLYGRSVRGPMDVLQETLEAREDSEETVVCYVLLMQGRLAKMTELVQKNLGRVQKSTKKRGMIAMPGSES